MKQTKRADRIMTITESNNRWFDENGNNWSTKESATRYSPTLTDCVYCRDCSNCSTCYCCRDCSDCSDCYACGNCRDCRDCYACSDCNSCYDCSNCSDCSNRSNCKECKNWFNSEIRKSVLIAVIVLIAVYVLPPVIYFMYVK